MIKVGFSTHHHNILSSTIRFFTKSEVSHTWLLVDDPLFKRPMVLEATETGIVLTPFDRFATKNDVVCILDPKHPLDSGMSEAGAWLGERYDFLGLVGTAFVLLGRWLKRKWKNPLSSSHAMFCSEFVVNVMQAAQYPGAENLVPTGTTPQDLLDFLR